MLALIEIHKHSVDDTEVNFYFLPLFDGNVLRAGPGLYRTFPFILLGSQLFTLLLSFFFQFLHRIAIALLRCVKRKCSCDRKKTYKILQDDYERSQRLEVWEMDHRLMELHFFIFSTIMFGTGIPIMYPICFVLTII